MSQDAQYEDVVYLKNGSVIRGMIIEQVPNQSIKIKTHDRNIFVFEFDQVERITKEEIPAELQTGKVHESPAPEFVPKEKGFESNFDLGLAINMDWGEPVIGFSGSAGYRFFTQFYAGAGAGVELFGNRTMVPVFMSIRNDFVRAKVTPFFRADLGYAFGWVEDADGSDWGGIFIDPAIGVRFNFTRNFSMNISSSIKFQRAYDHHYYSYPLEGDDYENRTLDTYRMLTFKVGFSF
ncbi:MAG TPA: hypothetical protein VK994_07730 [Bacteroidales bacterium]|nr:hypothetical protein [Bacteroidales bacterium]